MQKEIFNIYKPLGQTPLQALEAFKRKIKLPENYKMTYAGRLDPMAEGVLILLAGKKLAEKDKFLKLNKIYRAQILFGISTDTFDLLGKISCPFRANAPERGIPCKKSIGYTRDGVEIKTKYIKQTLLPEENLPTFSKIKHEIKNLIGNILLPIPPYSSVPIKGKPSFMHARAGKLNVNNMQSRGMEILAIKFHSYKKISGQTVLNTARKHIAKVSGDFRQKEILKLWEEKLKPGFRLGGRNDTSKHFKILDITISCASGTYIRSIAHRLGENLSCPALLYNLKRTAVGKYRINKSVILQERDY